jgi:acyl-CoA hydrolase
MSRLVQLEQNASALAARHVWLVTGRGPLEPAALVERLGAFAARLVGARARLAVVSSGVERLRLHAALHGGDTLVVTAALERPGPSRWPVSVVVRRSEGSRAPVVAEGVLVFVPEGEVPASPPRPAPLQPRAGWAPVSTTFVARASTSDWLLSGNLLAWVHATALLSAQGFAGVELQPVALEAVALRGPIEPLEAIDLECSVGRASAGGIRVLSELTSAARGAPVLSAVTRFEPSRAPSGPARLLAG